MRCPPGGVNVGKRRRPSPGSRPPRARYHRCVHASWATGLAIAAAVAALGGAAIWLRLRLRRRPRLRRRWRFRAQPRYPVVLAHGLFGFDELGVGTLRQAYWKGIRAALEQDGCEVIVPVVPPVDSIAQRAEALARALAQVEARRFNVLAHSMGGLDARFAVARLGLGPRVAALVTVGTPHRGSPLADLSTDLLRRLGVQRLFEAAGLPLDALHDLATARMARFNDEVPDARGVAYASVVGVVHRKRRTNPLLLPGYLWMRPRWGPNDGMVPASSQRWGEVLAEVEADHWAQTGWSRHFQAADFWVRLVRELRALGF
jgi:triacylglycerol lipase